MLFIQVVPVTSVFEPLCFGPISPIFEKSYRVKNHPKLQTKYVINSYKYYFIRIWAIWLDVLLFTILINCLKTCVFHIAVQTRSLRRHQYKFSVEVLAPSQKQKNMKRTTSHMQRCMLWMQKKMRPNKKQQKIFQHTNCREIHV